jgi:hypothetical protein
MAEVRLPVAPTTPATALVRVSPSGVPGDGAVSRPFTLQTPTITILMPSATAQWGIGTTQRADFVRNFPAGTSSTWRQSLDVSRDGGVTWQELRGGLLAGDPLTWQVTGPVGPARVRVRVIDEVVGVIAQDDSDVFAIVPGVRVTSPNTAVSWPIGAIRVIRWTHSYGAAQTFDIDFSADGGLSWSSFATTVPAATATTGMHTAVLPTTPTEEGLFRVSPAGAPGDGDTSDVPFTLR